MSTERKSFLLCWYIIIVDEELLTRDWSKIVSEWLLASSFQGNSLFIACLASLQPAVTATVQYRHEQQGHLFAARKSGWYEQGVISRFDNHFRLRVVSLQIVLMTDEIGESSHYCCVVHADIMPSFCWLNISCISFQSRKNDYAYLNVQYVINLASMLFVWILTQWQQLRAFLVYTVDGRKPNRLLLKHL